MKKTNLILRIVTATFICLGYNSKYVNANENNQDKLINVNLINHYSKSNFVNPIISDSGYNTHPSIFSDLEPTHWGFQALVNLSNQYSCANGYDDRSFHGVESISRYEAAAFLNACLGQIYEVTDEIRNLIREFNAELEFISTRVDKLETNNGQLESNNFSPTAKINFAIFNWYQANQFTGSQTSNEYDKSYGSFTNQYGIIPSLKVSFTGEDLLGIYGVVGSCSADNVTAGSPLLATYAPQCAAQFSSDNSLVLWRMFYTTPVFADGLKLTIGPKLYAFDFLPVSNAVFGPKGGATIGLKALPLDILQNAGVPGVYPLINGPGAGISYTKDAWSAAAGFVSSNGGEDSSGKGLFGDNSVKETVVQFAVTKPGAGFQLAWTNTNYPLSNSFVFQEGTPLSALPFNGNVSKFVNTFAGGGYWYIHPNLSISGGVKKMYYTANKGYSEIALAAGETAASLTGVVTMQWERALIDDLTLGLSYAVPGYVTKNPSNLGVDQQPNALLGFANWSISNNIQISPWIYWIKGAGGKDDPETTTLGAALMTSFYF